MTPDAIIEAHANKLLDEFLESKEHSDMCEEDCPGTCVLDYDDDDRDYETEAEDRAERKAERGDW